MLSFMMPHLDDATFANARVLQPGAACAASSADATGRRALSMRTGIAAAAAAAALQPSGRARRAKSAIVVVGVECLCVSSTDRSHSCC